MATIRAPRCGRWLLVYASVALICGAMTIFVRIAFSADNTTTVQTIVKGLEYRGAALGNVLAEGYIKVFRSEREARKVERLVREEAQKAGAEPPHRQEWRRAIVFFRFVIAATTPMRWWAELLAGDDGGLSIVPVQNPHRGGEPQAAGKEDFRLVSVGNGEYVSIYDDTANVATVHPFDPQLCPEEVSKLYSNILAKSGFARLIEKHGAQLVRKEVVQGQECLVLEVTGPRGQNILTPAHFTIWVAPGRSFIPLRVEYLGPQFADATARAAYVEICSNLVQLDNGLWVPLSNQKQIYTYLDGKYLWEHTRIWHITRLEGGDDAPSLREWQANWLAALPIGTKVWEGIGAPASGHFVVGNVEEIAAEFAGEDPPPLELR